MYTVTEVNPVPKRKESYLIVRYLIDLATCCDLPNQRVIPSEVGVVELSDPAYFFFFLHPTRFSQCLYRVARETNIDI